MIDELYHKEKRYVRQYIREDLIHPHNTIFNLERCHNLQTATGVEKRQKTAAKKNHQKMGEQQPFFEEIHGDRTGKNSDARA